MVQRILILTILILSQISAETSIWRISKGSNHIYLGGTIHVLRPQDYPLPAEFDSCYNRSETVVLETDMGVVNSADFQQKLMAAMVYPSGSTIKEHLSDETYTLLKNYLSTKNVPFSTVERFKPPMISLIITQWEMGKYEMAEKGVDAHYYEKAMSDKKNFLGLETTEQQISFLAGMGEDDPDGLIRNTLEEMDEMENLIVSMISYWRSGNEKKLAKTIIKELKTKHPEIYKNLIIDRNNAWYPKIKDMLNTEEVELILVGTGHLIGKKGMVNMLKKDGYTVKQVSLSDFRSSK